MDSGWLKRWGANQTAAGFAVSTGLGLLLGVVGPFGSYSNGPLPGRVAYWVLSLWGGWAVFGLTLPWIAGIAARRRIAVWLWTPPAIALLALPAAVLSRTLAGVLWPETGRVPRLEWYAQSVVVSLIATALLLWWMRRHPYNIDTGAGSTDPRDRLPSALGREVLCLEMEDHYVRVHTPRGSTLVLMSLSQAMAGLADVEGARTHRSWWIARSAVEGVAVDGRNLKLRLTGGLEAPVSRARVGELRAEGWLGA